MLSDFASQTASLPDQLSLYHLWQTATRLQRPTALWRLPQQRTKHLVVSADKNLSLVEIDPDALPSGFAVNGFEQGWHLSDNSPFIRADVQADWSESTPIRLSSPTNHTAFLAEFRHELIHQTQTPTSQPTALNVQVLPNSPAQQDTYRQQVAEAVAAIENGLFRKVVLSRTKQARFAENPNIAVLFERLCNAYPSAFVSAIFLPDTGQIWLCATPERLVSQKADGIFQTLSLAGTQSSVHEDGTPKRPAAALWSQKEIEEQALVSRYIIDCFKKIRLREFSEEGPKTMSAGNLMHLGTSFSVDTHQVHYPHLLAVMLRLLHPTSAVCGMPREAAYTFIKAHETHNRELYAGFVGPVNINTDGSGLATHLYVHIRCLKLEGKQATLYAGAGLTADSEPEKEWHETELKCQTLLRVLT